MFPARQFPAREIFMQTKNMAYEFREDHLVCEPPSPLGRKLETVAVTRRWLEREGGGGELELATETRGARWVFRSITGYECIPSSSRCIIVTPTPPIRVLPAQVGGMVVGLPVIVLRIMLAPACEPSFLIKRNLCRLREVTWKFRIRDAVATKLTRIVASLPSPPPPPFRD